MNNEGQRKQSTTTMLGYEIDASSQSSLCAELAEWASSGDRCRYLACINPHSYVVARQSPAFADALSSADWLIPDGAGIVLASRILNGGIEHRVTGSDIFHGVSSLLDSRGSRVFLLGSTEENLEKMRARLAVDYPGLVVAGCLAPPFREQFSAEENETMIQAINAARADVLWVGLSSPKQDLWLRAHAARLDVRFAAGIGAVFDFYTGRVKRPSALAQSLKMEWLVRLLGDFRRLWRRTLVSAPNFLLCVLKERLGGSGGSGPSGMLS